MSTTLPPDVRIVGYDMMTLREALRCFERTGQRSNVLERGKLFPTIADGAILFEEMIERGLINFPNSDHSQDRLTQAGLALAGAKNKRTTLAAADKVLADLFARIDDYNRDPKALKRIDQAWLYGSVMRREDTVGDIDIALTTSWNPAYADREARRNRVAELLLEAPPSYDNFRAVDWAYQPHIFGRRRHPLLAGLEFGLVDLTSLSVPCQLVYDRKRGGRVNDAILEKHPEAEERSEEYGPPRTLPDLTFLHAVPEVMDATWTTGSYPPSCVSLRQMFDRRLDEIGLQYGYNYVFAHHWRAIGSIPWTPLAFGRNAHVDGRRTVVLGHTGRDNASATATLTRAVTAGEDGVELASSIRDLEGDNPSDAPSQIAIIAGLILATDVHRQWQRLSEDPAKLDHTISVVVDNTALPIAACRAFDRSFMYWLTRLEEEFEVDLGLTHIEGLLLSPDRQSARSYLRDINTPRWTDGALEDRPGLSAGM